MNRYRSARRTPPVAAPIVAFLLIACFGLLFVTGCSRSTDTVDKTEDDTFTAEDVARFQQLSQGSESGSSMGMAGTSSPYAGAGPLALTAGSGGTIASAPAVDPALRKKYDAIRAGSATGNGTNAYRVTNAFLNVRGEPRASAVFVERLNQGSVVQLLEFTNGQWAKITTPEGKTGYVSAQYIARLTTADALEREKKAFDGLYYVNFTFLNVRAAPQTGSEKIGEIPGQAFVRPLSMEKGWAKVKLGDKEGYASTQYLSPFRPHFLVRQETFQVPILRYAVDQDGVLFALTQHLAALKAAGVRFLTFRDLAVLVQTQEVRDARLPAKGVLVAIIGVTAQNVRSVSDALSTAGVPVTLFLQTDQVGISGISEKMLQTLLANGFAIESAGHTGDDLRTLTNAQTQLELNQSRVLLEQLAHTTVFAIAYPMGGANDRVLGQAADAGYLFGMGSAPDAHFTREQFLRLPSYAVTAGMTGEDVTKLVK